MEILQLIFLLLAYSVGLVMLFLMLICYKRKIEFLETIFVAGSFLLLVMSATASSVLSLIQPSSENTFYVFILISMILLGVTTPLNVYKERIVTVKQRTKQLIIGLGAVLFITVITFHFLGLLPSIETVVTLFMFGSITYSMLIIRKTAPIAQFVHREKVERLTALVCICVLPLTLAIDYLPEYLPVLQWENFAPIRLTLPMLFMFIAMGKIIDDIKRLSLFNQPSQGISEDQMKRFNFTKRETEIVGLLVKGATYNQISEALFISLPTVKTHVSNIYKKAGVNNKVALINSLSPS